MNMRSSTTTVTFSNTFALPGYPGELPAGDYEIVVEEELLQGLSFEAWKRTATYLIVRGRGRRTGLTEMLATTENDLNEALGRDAPAIRNNTDSDAALSPQEDLE